MPCFLEERVSRVAGPNLFTKTGLLTHTPDADFVLDRTPGHPNCVCAAGAAHALKFASVIGRALAELPVDGTTPSDISAFRFDRPGLKAPAACNLPAG